MLRTRRGRRLAVAIGAVLALALLVAGEARAGRYAVAQCGWGVGADASWADTTGGAKFYPASACVPPPGGDPFAGMHLKSFTRASRGTVSGTRFARWRWQAPAGTGITAVRGTWWHALHDGFEQRIGVRTPAGGFAPFAAAAATDTALRELSAGFAAPMPALEDRLLCARGESRWCVLDPVSWSGLRAVTITLEDGTAPAASAGGEVLAGGWRRGAQTLAVGGSDRGSGVRFGETSLDGTRVALTEYACAKVSVGGEWRGRRLRPCELSVSATQAVATTAFSDGPHTLVHCVTDFGHNVGCSAPRQVLIDNNAPAHPRALALDGDEGWRRVNDFDLSWTNPPQGAASPIAGAGWRLAGPAGFDSGGRFAAGRDRVGLSDLAVPAPGVYSLAVWLRDEAGNEDPSAAATVPLRFDDVPPGVAFAAGEAGGVPDPLTVEVADAHSGPAAGTISYRRLGTGRWIELSTRLVAGEERGVARLLAPAPTFAPGVYAFRAEAVDAAGNVATTTRRADGTAMAVRVVVPAEVPRARTRLLARLRGDGSGGRAVTVGFGSDAVLRGRLVGPGGAGLAGRELRIVVRPSRGALGRVVRRTLRTGERGGFRLRLRPGPSRRVAVAFPGDARFEPARRAPLELRVRGGVTLAAAPMSLRTGEAVRLRGLVRSRGARLPRRGKLVAIEYLERAARRWRPVLLTRTDHRGRFRTRYRFRYVSGGAAIRLRATAPPEERWPYVRGSSPPVTVQVTAR